MSWRVILAVLAVAGVSVLAAMDWRPVPVARAPKAVTVAAPAPVVTPPPVAQAPAAPAATSGAAPEPVSSNAPVLAEDVEQADTAQAQAKPAELAAPPNCNVAACERAYRSFRKSDCTYQPLEGARRLCTKR